MRIIIGADIVPTKSNINVFADGNIKDLLGDELVSIIEQADFRVFNLETPLTDEETPIQKCGDALFSPTKSIVGLSAMHINLVTLGNNHIMDQGYHGFHSTINALDKAEIAYVGAGFTPEEAKKPFYFSCEDKKIGIYACAEHEFSIVGDNCPGANPIDTLETFDSIQQIKMHCDYLIVLYHGGKEHYRYPSPYLQKICRKMINNGADLVVCQHSHCIGAKEEYKHGTIVYGQGNFVFDGSETEFWKTSLLIQILDDFKIDYLPLVKHENGVRLADDKTGTQILHEFDMRSKEIENESTLKEYYANFAYEYISDFLSIASGKKYSIITRIINKLSGNNRVIKKHINMKYNKSKRLTLLNRIECEANRELFITGLKQSIERIR